VKPQTLRRALSVALLAIAAAIPSPYARAAGEFRARGFMLPAGSVKIDDDRYRLPMGWDDMQRYLRNTYPAAKYTRHALRNQAGVRAIHVDNPRPAEGEWTGVNLYEAARGEVRVYILNKGGDDADASDAK